MDPGLLMPDSITPGRWPIVSLHFSPLGSLRSRGISVSPRRLLITTSGVHDTKAGHHVLNTCPNAYKWLIYLKSSVYMAPPNRVNQF